MVSGNLTKDYEALRNDLKTLRSDVSALAEALVAGGKGRAQAAKDSAVEQARRRLEQISSQTNAACNRGREVVDTVERQVATHPCKSLSAVFGIGLLLGAALNWWCHRCRT